MKILTICIPTYNRRDRVLEDLQEYLSVDDDRFYIKYSDNASTDGTEEAFKPFLNNKKFIYKRNETNLGNMPNQRLALSDNPSVYSVLVVDKDFFNIKLLPQFIDLLEREKPDFGYIDPSCGFNSDLPEGMYSVEKYSPGVEAVKKMAYLSKHPSGYFYKTSIYKEGVESKLFEGVDAMFDFPYELINSGLALKYNSMIIRWPLIIRAAARKYEDKSKSYSKSFLWFEYPRRKDFYKEYLRNISLLDISFSDRRSLERKVTKDAMIGVSTALAQYWRDEISCYHYHVDTRIVSYKEMFNNIKGILKLRRDYVKSNAKLPKLRMVDWFYLIVRLSLSLIKDFYCRINNKNSNKHI